LKEDDTVIITSTLIKNAADFEYTISEEGITIEGYSEEIKTELANPWDMIEV
jgi:hypothetical protein